MTASVSPEMLRLLRDPAARPEISAGARADAMLRGFVLKQMAEALRAQKIPTLIVKGAALALTVYPDPAARWMSDIDLLVAEKDQGRAVRALERLGWLVAKNEERHLSGQMLGEVMVQARAGTMTFTVEVHSSLDKVVRRPIAFADLMDRAENAPGLEGLSVPSRENHTLLVALHASTHEFRHALALGDMEQLLRAGIDRDELQRQTARFQLRTVMFVMLRVLGNLRAASIDDDLLGRFDVDPKRKVALGRFYDVERFPPIRGEEELGATWLFRQAPLWDDPVMFARGVAKFAAMRAMERMMARLAR